MSIRPLQLRHWQTHRKSQPDKTNVEDASVCAWFETFTPSRLRLWKLYAQKRLETDLFRRTF